MAFWKEKQEGNKSLKVIGIVQEPSGTLEAHALQLATLQRETHVANTGLRKRYRSSQFLVRTEHTLMLLWHYGYNRANTAKSGFHKQILVSPVAMMLRSWRSLFCPISCFLVNLWKTMRHNLTRTKLPHNQNEICLFFMWLIKKTALHIIKS